MKQVQVGDDGENNYEQNQARRKGLYNPRHELGHPFHVPLYKITYSQGYHQGKYVSRDVLVRHFNVAALENQLPEGEKPERHHPESGDGTYGRHHYR